MSTYLETTQELYKEAALAPQASLCCASSTPYALPGLVVPEEMTAMNKRFFIPPPSASHLPIPQYISGSFEAKNVAPIAGHHGENHRLN